MHPEMERIQNCLAAVRRHTDFVPAPDSAALPTW